VTSRAAPCVASKAARRHAILAAMRCVRHVGLVAVLGLLAADVPQDPGDVLTVTRKTTKLRSQKRSFAPGVADLKEGDKLAYESKDGAWYAAKLGTKSGWLHESDVSTNPEVRLSGQGVRESYSTTETSAARKGFNPQVEKQYRADNPSLDRAFRAIDELEARELPEAELRAFLTEGGLLREGR
jgi:hypothetical protein